MIRHLIGAVALIIGIIGILSAVMLAGVLKLIHWLIFTLLPASYRQLTAKQETLISPEANPISEDSHYEGELKDCPPALLAPTLAYYVTEIRRLFFGQEPRDYRKTLEDPKLPEIDRAIHEYLLFVYARDIPKEISEELEKRIRRVAEWVAADFMLTGYQQCNLPPSFEWVAPMLIEVLVELKRRGLPVRVHEINLQENHHATG